MPCNFRQHRGIPHTLSAGQWSVLSDMFAPSSVQKWFSGSWIFFFSFVMETESKSHCDEQHPHQAEDTSRKLAQSSKLSGTCLNRDC